MIIKNKNIFKIISFFIFLCCGLFLSSNIVSAQSTLDQEQQDFFAQNNILFYEPCATGGGSWNGKELAFEDLDWSDEHHRARQIVETYGELAMGLQREYGVPWDVVFAQMHIESNFGGAYYSQDPELAKQFDWLGLSYASSQWLSLGPQTVGSPRWGRYETISKMIMSWAVHFARNGNYDPAFAFTDPNNYDLGGFAWGFIHKYAPAGENDPVAYSAEISKTIDEYVRPVADEKGWPSSSELQKKENIQIGGQWPIPPYGDVQNDVHAKYGDNSVLPQGAGGGTSQDQGFCYNSDNFPFYKQPDGSSCGPTAFAMIATMVTGKEVTPQETIQKFTDLGVYDTSRGTYDGAIPKVAPEYNMEFEKIESSGSDDTINKITESLKSGHLLWVAGNGSYPFTGGGHFIVLRGINQEGKWLIANPSDGKGKDESYDPSQIVAGIQTRNIYAFKFSNNNSNCNDKCKTQGNGELKDGGYQSAEEADRAVMEPYRALRDTPSATLHSQYGIPIGTGCGGTDLENCYAFSMYFLNKYSTLSDGGVVQSSGWGDADQLVSHLGSQYGVPTGGTPQVYSIFSVPGPHTGVVLGINQAAGKIIIGEAGCNSGWDFIGAKEKELSQFTNGSYTYAYLGDRLKGGLKK